VWNGHNFVDPIPQWKSSLLASKTRAQARLADLAQDLIQVSRAESMEIPIQDAESTFHSIQTTHR